MNTESHIAGNIIELGPYLRQRCAWCGTVLLDYDLRNLMYEETTAPEDRMPATWEVGAIIRRAGAISEIVDHEDGSPVPDDCCAKLDPAVTT